MLCTFIKLKTVKGKLWKILSIFKTIYFKIQTWRPTFSDKWCNLKFKYFLILPSPTLHHILYVGYIQNLPIEHYAGYQAGWKSKCRIMFFGNKYKRCEMYIRHPAEIETSSIFFANRLWSQPSGQVDMKVINSTGLPTFSLIKNIIWSSDLCRSPPQLGL